jgi:TolA-binding protein
MQFIAMELLEGEPLDRRIGGRPLGISAVVDYGMQVADALAVAHGQGILHRDIKPANIFITTRGQAKVLDFGLAKLLDPGPAAGVTHAATGLLTTQQGTALGTIAYMSPEQARGDDLDARTDLFSFGLVLYEMATGQRTFEGHTSAVVFDAILNREPRAPIELNANVPLSLERIIGRCLQKDRQARYGAASEIRVELEQVRRERESGVTSSRSLTVASSSVPTGTSWPSGTVAAAVPAPKRAGRLGLYGALALAVIGVGALAGAALLLQHASSATVGSAPEPSSLAPVATSGAPAATKEPAAAPPATPPATTPGPAATGGSAAPAAPGRSSGTRAGDAGASAAAAAVVPSGSAPAPAAGGAATDNAARVPASKTADAEALRIARAKYDAQLYDQALGDLQALVAKYGSSPSAPEAFLLMGSIHSRQNKPDDAMAAYVELRSKYPASPAAAEATFQNAELILRSRRDDREKTAMGLFSSIFTAYPTSPLAPRALARRATLEQKQRLRVTDEELGKVVPAELGTYRTLVSRYPSAPEAESAYESLAKLYEDQKRYDLAASALLDLAKRFPSNRIDAAWRAGEMYEERVKDVARAKASYQLVPEQSARFKDAQRKLQSGT